MSAGTAKAVPSGSYASKTATSQWEAGDFITSRGAKYASAMASRPELQR